MKKLVFALCMFFGGVAVVNAQDTTSTTSPTDPTSTTQSQSSSITMQDEGRVKIKSQELPDAVKSSLESQEYRGWLVNSAYKMDGSADATSATGSSSGAASDSTSVSGNTSSSAYGEEVYIVELKNGAQTKTVRFDKDGKKLDDEGMDNDQK